MARIIDLITRESLHAYLDDRLDGRASEAVERRLEEDEAAARSVGAYRDHAEAVRARLARELERPAPPEVDDLVRRLVDALNDRAEPAD